MGKTTTKENTKCKPIYVVVGKEDVLVSARCEELINKLLPPQQRTMGLFNADSDKATAVDVLDELRTLPFLSEKRAVLVKRADNFVSKYRQLLEAYFDNPSSTGVLILSVNSWPGNTKLAKKLSKVGQLIKVQEPSSWQLPSRLTQYAREAHKKGLSKTVAELLIELIGENVGQLYSEIDKLALYAQSENAITTQHIESLIGHNRLFNAFAVIDSILTNNISQAINRLRKMLAEDRSAEYTIVGAFAYHFRRMFKAKVLLDEGAHPNEIIKSLRIWSNKEAFISQLGKISLTQIGSILGKLAAIDYRIKTGQTKSQVAMEQLVLSSATQT